MVSRGVLSLLLCVFGAAAQAGFFQGSTTNFAFGEPIDETRVYALSCFAAETCLEAPPMSVGHGEFYGTCGQSAIGILSSGQSSNGDDCRYTGYVDWASGGKVFRGYVACPCNSDWGTYDTDMDGVVNSLDVASMDSSVGGANPQQAADDFLGSVAAVGVMCLAFLGGLALGGVLI